MFEIEEAGIDWSVREPRLTREELAGAEFLDPGDPRACDDTADVLVEEAGAIGFGVATLPRLLEVPFTELSETARSRALETLTRFECYLGGLKAELTGLIAGPSPATPELRREDYAAHEISVATRVSVYAADDQICFARDLSERLHATAAAMADGRITERQARHLSEATGHLDVQVAREIEAKVLTFSHRQDLTLFKASVKRWLAKLDPDFTARATAARRQCVVEHSARDDGTGELFIRGPLEITTAISMALTAYAAKTKPTLEGTTAQRKLAGLRDMIDTYLTDPTCPRRHGRLPILNITIDLATLLGLRAGIAEIPGVGAIPADVARWLLADGTVIKRTGGWRRSPTGSAHAASRSITYNDTPANRAQPKPATSPATPGRRSSEGDGVCRTRAKRGLWRQPTPRSIAVAPSQNPRGLDLRERHRNRGHHLDQPNLRPHLRNPPLRLPRGAITRR